MLKPNAPRMAGLLNAVRTSKVRDERKQLIGELKAAVANIHVHETMVDPATDAGTRADIANDLESAAEFARAKAAFKVEANLRDTISVLRANNLED
jgi:hypothetical protein